MNNRTALSPPHYEMRPELARRAGCRLATVVGRFRSAARPLARCCVGHLRGVCYLLLSCHTRSVELTRYWALKELLLNTLSALPRAENVMLLSFYAGSTGKKFLLASRELRELEGLWPPGLFTAVEGSCSRCWSILLCTDSTSFLPWPDVAWAAVAAHQSIGSLRAKSTMQFVRPVGS